MSTNFTTWALTAGRRAEFNRYRTPGLLLLGELLVGEGGGVYEGRLHSSNMARSSVMMGGGGQGRRSSDLNPVPGRERKFRPPAQVASSRLIGHALVPVSRARSGPQHSLPYT
ncbi:MAG: hypothetical protein AAGC91_06780 [Pseudomonadota bacterium]